MIYIDCYGIDVSDKCFTVGKISKITDTKTGTEKESLITPSYATSFASALKCVRKMMQREAIKNTDGDLNAAINAIRRSDVRFESLIAEFKFN